MEEGVVNELMRGPLRDLFDSRQLITDVSGSGNNWAQGYNDYGVRYRDQLLEKVRQSTQSHRWPSYSLSVCQVRRPVEHCDSLQSFFFLHSLGGGTGSGTGCYLLQRTVTGMDTHSSDLHIVCVWCGVCEVLEDAYPDVYRFVTAVFPSEDDDVITSPYNRHTHTHTCTAASDSISKYAIAGVCVCHVSALALRVLKEHASCVLPIANDALIKMTNAMTAKVAPPPLPHHTHAYFLSACLQAEVSQQLGRVLPPQSVSPWESVSVRAPGRPGQGRGRKTHQHPFSKMNGIVANLLLDLTRSPTCMTQCAFVNGVCVSMCAVLCASRARSTSTSTKSLPTWYTPHLAAHTECSSCQCAGLSISASHPSLRCRIRVCISCCRR